MIDCCRIVITKIFVHSRLSLQNASAPTVEPNKHRHVRIHFSYILCTCIHFRILCSLQITFWLGIYFNGTTWAWQNGEDTEWTNWMNTDYLPSQRCAVARSESPYGWSTRACNDTYAYVCVKEEGKGDKSCL